MRPSPLDPADLHTLPVLEFGPPGPGRDMLVAAVLDGSKTGSTNLDVVYRLWQQEVPTVGDRVALLDSAGARVAVIEYTAVRRTTLDRVDEVTAATESCSLPEWHRRHQEFWAGLADDIRVHLADPHWTLGADEQVISTTFTATRVGGPTGLGVIGAGFHSTTNILPSLVLAGIPIDGLATRDLRRSEAALLRAGSTGRPYAAASDLLADNSIVDVVVIAQPGDQMDLTLAAIAAGKNVFADKPLGWTSADARRIADAAEAADAVVMVGFMKRHAPAYVQLRSLAESGALGRIRSFDIVFGCDSTPFCATEEDFVKLAAIHLVDLTRFLFGEAVDVTARSHSTGSHVALSVVVTVADGVVGTLSLSGLPGCTSEIEQVRVTGDTGWAVVEDATTLTSHVREPADTPSWRSPTERTTTVAPVVSAMSGVEQHLFTRGFVGELQAFREAARTGGSPSSSAADNVATMQLCEQILDSAAAHRTAVANPGVLTR
ncbi:ASCH domain-containing protein [Nakamurella silvestris]|nr:ASCH domain-containing protein [Nakamurella silvestris]